MAKSWNCVIEFLWEPCYKIGNGPFSLKLCLPGSSADNLCKQFGPRSGSIHFPDLSQNCLAQGVRWHIGRFLDLISKVRWFETHRRLCFGP